ncbi:MAG: tetratricopeptide repeat protein [Phycisphaerae bacterium]
MLHAARISTRFAVIVASTAFATASLLAQPAATQAPASQPRSERELQPLIGIPRAEVPASSPTSNEPTAELRTLFETARARIEDDNIPEAIDRLKEASAKSLGKAYYDLEYLSALIAIRVNDLDAALTHARRAAELRPASIDANYVMGELLTTRGQFGEAIGYLRGATDAARELSNGKRTLSWMKLAACLAQEGYLLAASEAFAKFDQAIWVDNPEHRNLPEIQGWLEEQPRGAFEDRVELAGRLSRPQDALRVTSEALDRWPDDVYVARMHGYVLIDAKKPADALALAKQWIYKPGGIPGVVSLAIDAAVEAGEFDRWIASVQEEIRGGRSFELGQAIVPRLLGSKRYDATVGVAEALIARERDVDAMQWTASFAEWRSGKRAAAVERVATWLVCRPKGSEPSPRLVEHWMSAMHASPGEVAAIVSEFRQRGERSAARDFVLALAAMGSNQFALADGLLKTALEQDQAFLPARVAQIQIMLAGYDWDAARAAAQKLQKEHPDSAAVSLCVAMALDGLDENDDARSAFQRAIRQQPKDLSYPLAAAQHCRRVGDKLGAQRFFGEALAIDANDAAALEGLLETYLRDHKVPLARELFRQIERSGGESRFVRRLSLMYRFRDRIFVPSYLNELRSLLVSDPADVRSGRTLAEGLIGMDQIADAEAVLKQVLAVAPDDYQSLLISSTLATRQLQFERAVETLETLVKRYPNRIAVLALLADAYLADFRSKEARLTIQRLIERAEPEQRDGLIARLVETYRTFGDYDAGLEYIEERLKPNPLDERWQRERLNLLVLAERCDEAIQIAGKALEQNAAAESLRTQFLGVAWECKQYRAAEEKLRAWMAAATDKAPIVDWLIDTLVRDGRGDEAIKLIDEQPARSLREAQLHRYWRGKSEEARGQRDLAIKEFVALLNERGTDASIRRAVIAELIDVYARAGQADEALGLVDEYVGALPADAIAQVKLRVRRQILQNAGREAEYTLVLEQLYAIDPQDAGMNNDLGYTWVDQNLHVEKAMSMIRMAVADQPLNAAFIDSLGWAHYKLGQFEEARKWLSRAVSLPAGQDPVLFDHAADAEFRLGDSAAAAKHWTKSAEIAEKELKESRQPLPDREKLLTSVRGKLAAVERGEKPSLAPTVAEHSAGKK